MSRALLTLTGPDRVAFLQGLLTQDVTKLADERIQFAALLSPQGKILHDMFVLHGEESIRIDTHAADADTLLARLKRYQLRAKLTLTMDEAQHVALCAAGTEGALPDPRHAALPWRCYESPSPPALSCQRRLASSEEAPFLPLPELHRDFAPDTTLPMDVGYDGLHAISFTKGCYVGQEVTARMHYKHLVKKGFYHIQSAEAPLTLGAMLHSAERPLAPLTHVQGRHGLAFLRDADAAQPLTVEGIPVTATRPAWRVAP